MRWLPETQAKPDALCMPTDRVARRACDNDSPARRLNDSSSVRSSWRGAVGAILRVCRTLRIDEPMRFTERMDDRGIRSGERQVREVAPMALLAILRRDPVARSERAGCRSGPLELRPANGHLGASVLRVPVVWHRDSDSERGAPAYRAGAPATVRWRTQRPPQRACHPARLYALALLCRTHVVEQSLQR